MTADCPDCLIERPLLPQSHGCEGFCRVAISHQVDRLALAQSPDVSLTPFRDGVRRLASRSPYRDYNDLITDVDYPLSGSGSALPRPQPFLGVLSELLDTHALSPAGNQITGPGDTHVWVEDILRPEIASLECA